MAEETENSASTTESLLEKISEKIHGHHASSSSSLEADYDQEEPVSHLPPQPKIYRLFGREKPVHQAIGGGMTADVLLWRNKKISATVLGGATAIWIFFILLEYHLLNLVCHILIFLLSSLFLLSNATALLKKPRLHIPEVYIPDEPFTAIASAMIIEINRGFSVLRDIASRRDLKKFLMVIAGLWILSILGSWCDFMTLLYVGFIMLHTLPVLYEKFEHKIDPFAERAIGEVKQQYAAIRGKVVRTIPMELTKKKA